MSFDETIAALDHILQADRQRKEGSLALLRAVVTGLDGTPVPEEPVGDGDEGAPPARRATAPSRPFVPIPKRKTHGGRFGPAVIAKMRARALR